MRACVRLVGERNRSKGRAEYVRGVRAVIGVDVLHKNDTNCEGLGCTFKSRYGNKQGPVIRCRWRQHVQLPHSVWFRGTYPLELELCKTSGWWVGSLACLLLPIHSSTGPLSGQAASSVRPPAHVPRLTNFPSP